MPTHSDENGFRIIPVILCGGSGSRLWPMSQKSKPKQFLRLTDDHSLLQNTVKRALRVSGAKAQDVVTVTLREMSSQIKEQYEEIDSDLIHHILEEPSARNTSAAVALAGLYVQEKFGDQAVLWILPADHFIGDEDALKKSLDDAIRGAQNGFLMTFGITPSRPETGYGYIKSGSALEDQKDVLAIDSFVEKPNAAKALTFLQSGNYLWNSGMFVFDAQTLVKAYENYSHDILNNVRQSISYQDNKLVVKDNVYNVVTKEPFDTAIMEKASNIAVVPSNPAWSDIGSWESLWEISDKDEAQNVVKGEAIFKNAERNFVNTSKSFVALIGVKDLAVIETKDAILVADMADSDSLKIVVNEINSLQCADHSKNKQPNKKVA